MRLAFPNLAVIFKWCMAARQHTHTHRVSVGFRPQFIYTYIHPQRTHLSVCLWFENNIYCNFSPKQKKYKTKEHENSNILFSHSMVTSHFQIAFATAALGEGKVDGFCFLLFIFIRLLSKSSYFSYECEMVNKIHSAFFFLRSPWNNFQKQHQNKNVVFLWFHFKRILSFILFAK